MNAGPLLTDLQGSVAVVIFNQPAHGNSLSTELLFQLDVLLSTLINNPALKTLIFTGVDNAFLSGANIRELSSLDSESAREFSLLGQRLVQKVSNAPQLTIAAINGYCMGGGLDFALGCDVRLASSTAVFAHPGARLGIITGWGGTQRLPRLIGKTRAIEFLVTARRLSSKEAKDFGLISGIFDPVIDEAKALASKRQSLFA
jgi:enoyl-CoA hydratase